MPIPTWQIDATSVASERYYIKAETAEDAKAKLLGGEWDDWRDLGHDDMEILSVEKVA